VSDDHLRLLRRVAKSWRGRTHTHRAAEHATGSLGASRQADAERSSALAEARLATAERKRTTERTGETAAPTPKISELEAVSKHADQRAALERRRANLGRGNPTKLAELERIAAGAANRLRAARRSQADDRRD
jgi:hypothetical protein